MTDFVARLVTSRTELGDLEEEWRALADAGGADSVFSTPEWQLAWFDAMRDRAAIRVLTVRGGDGALRGLLPLALVDRGRGWRRLRVLELAGETIACGDHLGLVAQRADQERAWGAVESVFTESAGSADLVRMAAVDADGPQFALSARVASVSARAASAWREAAPRIALPETLDALDDLLGASLQRRSRYYARAFTAAFPAAEFPCHRHEESRSGALNRLVALHTARWAGGGVLSDSVMRDFLDHFSRAAAGRQWLRLYEIVHEGRSLGALFAIHWRGTASYYQSGWDPAFAKWQLGELLVMHAIREAVREGCHTFDFLRGAEQYKARFPVTTPALCFSEWTRTRRARRVVAIDGVLRRLLSAGGHWRSRASRLGRRVIGSHAPTSGDSH